MQKKQDSPRLARPSENRRVSRKLRCPKSKERGNVKGTGGRWLKLLFGLTLLLHTYRSRIDKRHKKSTISVNNSYDAFCCLKYSGRDYPGDISSRVVFSEKRGGTDRRYAHRGEWDQNKIPEPLLISRVQITVCWCGRGMREKWENTVEEMRDIMRPRTIRGVGSSWMVKGVIIFSFGVAAAHGEYACKT